MSILETILVLWCINIIYFDLHQRRIPNSIVWGACAVAILQVLLSGHTLLGTSWQSMFMGVGVGLMLTLPAYALRLLGGGDVKLMLALSLMGGWYFTLLAFVIATFLAVIFVLSHRFLTTIRSEAHHSKRWIPFGAAFSAGLVCAIGITV